MAGQYQDVMVLFHHCRDKRAAVWCEERGWKYHHAENIYGCEAQCVVLLDCDLSAEYITRARNMLIIVERWLLNNSPSLCSMIWCVNSNSGTIGGTQWNTRELQTMVIHSDEKYKCERMSDCPYTSTTIINKIPWTGEKDHEDQEDSKWNT